MVPRWQVHCIIIYHLETEPRHETFILSHLDLRGTLSGILAPARLLEDQLPGLSPDELPGRDRPPDAAGAHPGVLAPV